MDRMENGHKKDQWIPTETDWELSPCTGLTRQSWLEADRNILEGIFANIADFEDPVVLPRVETVITYPHKDSPAGFYEAEKRASAFEGLTRSFFFASVLIENDPEAMAGGYCLREYYKNQILRSCTPGDPLCVGNFEMLRQMSGTTDPFRAFQQTVETCALVIGLWISHEQIWETYTREERDRIADFLSSFGHNATVPQNWRLFNMLDLAFLYREGYPIDEEIMREHAAEILNYSVGDGWYRDGQCFDYYSCWAFNVYGPLWCEWYGYEKEPALAARFEANSNELMKTYPYFFDAEGRTNMWGRSNIYRNAATSAFDGNLFLRNPSVDYGLARRICSGSLLQFLGRGDTRIDGVFTLGFYGQFAPLVQGYSCAESPMWMGKAFLCLHLPKDHPFWTAKEHNGIWESLPEGGIAKTVLNGPALCVTDHKANGAAILRTGKVVKAPQDRHGIWNYGKLCYTAQYPWEAVDTAQQYVLHDETGDYDSLANATFWGGARDGVLYRRQFFDYRIDVETHWMQAVNLADLPVSHGILRADRLRLFRAPVTVTLGSFGFPVGRGLDHTEIIRQMPVRTPAEGSGCEAAQALILKGYDSLGREKQMAMTIYAGFDTLEVRESEHTNPDTQLSCVIEARGHRRKQYGGDECHMLISQVITKESHEAFAEEELFPLERIVYADGRGAGATGPVELFMKNGKRFRIDFDGLEGRLGL